MEVAEDQRAAAASVVTEEALAQEPAVRVLPAVEGGVAAREVAEEAARWEGAAAKASVAVAKAAVVPVAVSGRAA